MKVACQICEKIINNDGTLKGQKAFRYSIEVDKEPHIGTAVPSNCSGYLCHSCSQKVGNMLGITTK